MARAIGPHGVTGIGNGSRGADPIELLHTMMKIRRFEENAAEM